MSTRGLVVCSLLGLCPVGCLSGRPSADGGFLHLFVRNTVEAPCQAIDDQWFKFKSWRRARDAWAEQTRNCAVDAYSPDFREGFLEGYVDYLDAGGKGSPPAAPPARYWQTKYENDDGVRAIQDWFAGFRRGSEAAHASGYRETIVVPLSSLPGHVVPAPADVPTMSPVTPEETLPTPQREPGQQPNTESGPRP